MTLSARAHRPPRPRVLNCEMRLDADNIRSCPASSATMSLLGNPKSRYGNSDPVNAPVYSNFARRPCAVGRASRALLPASVTPQEYITSAQRGRVRSTEGSFQSCFESDNVFLIPLTVIRFITSIRGRVDLNERRGSSAAPGARAVARLARVEYDQWFHIVLYLCAVIFGGAVMQPVGEDVERLTFVPLGTFGTYVLLYSTGRECVEAAGARSRGAAVGQGTSSATAFTLLHSDILKRVLLTTEKKDHDDVSDIHDGKKYINVKDRDVHTEVRNIFEGETEAFMSVIETSMFETEIFVSETETFVSKIQTFTSEKIQKNIE
ncbi:hypothetical protein EVAR_103783_1 [Eumeta japonica]|uniref:Uncharacterized protein n=1 Tax=Eumeta variegata TaxID=151549 RepID=A0A4C1Z4Q5_EUMVA|nr:hypothetical protein EVAR_103783_1 [Eumeta japonica]